MKKGSLLYSLIVVVIAIVVALLFFQKHVAVLPENQSVAGSLKDVVATSTPQTDKADSNVFIATSTTPSSSAQSISSSTLKAAAKPMQVKPKNTGTAIATTTSPQVLTSPASTTAPVPVFATSTQPNVAISVSATSSTSTKKVYTVPVPSKRTINTQAIVGLLCHDYEDGLWTATGNIINPKGYILTNRHVAEDARYCEVAVPDKTIKLPDREEILKYNRRVTISGWRPYKAVKYYTPSLDGLSEAERDGMDFAIMEISAVNEGCETFGTCGPLPASFPYNVVSDYHLPTSTIRIPADRAPGYYLNPSVEETISYGYPTENGWAGPTHRLSGNLGYVFDYGQGDKKFKDEDFALLMEALYTTYGGASGSGVFYNGNIIGLVYARLVEIAQYEFVVPMYIISDNLKKAGLGSILARE